MINKHDRVWGLVSTTEMPNNVTPRTAACRVSGSEGSLDHNTEGKKGGTEGKTDA